MTMLYVVILCGVLSIVYAIWATQSVMAADQGNARMQEISAAIREGAQAYLTRQYTTIAIAGAVIFVIVGVLLGWLVAIGFLIGAVASAAVARRGVAWGLTPRRTPRRAHRSSAASRPRRRSSP